MDTAVGRPPRSRRRLAMDRLAEGCPSICRPRRAVHRAPATTGCPGRAHPSHRTPHRRARTGSSRPSANPWPTSATLGPTSTAAQSSGVAGEDLAGTDSPSPRSYCRHLGREIPQSLDIFVVFSTSRLASIGAGVYRRGLDGNASDATAVNFWSRYRALAEGAWALAQEIGATRFRGHLSQVENRRRRPAVQASCGSRTT